MKYPSSVNTSDLKVFVLGVGTGLTTGSYTKIAERIANKGIIVAIVDFASGSTLKDEGCIDNTYNNACNSIKNNLNNKYGSGNYTITSWIIGGHSAGGKQTYHKACTYTSGSHVPDGYIGFDPVDKGDGSTTIFPGYSLNKKTLILSPTTSGYNVKDNDNGREFYNNTNQNAPRNLVLFDNANHMYFAHDPLFPETILEGEFWDVIADMVHSFMVNDQTTFANYASNYPNSSYPSYYCTGSTDVPYP